MLHSSIVTPMCGVQLLKDGKRAKDLMLVLGLNETIDQFAMVNSVHWYGHKLWGRMVISCGEDGHMLWGRMVIHCGGGWSYVVG